MCEKIAAIKYDSQLFAGVTSQSFVSHSIEGAGVIATHFQ